MQIGNRMQLQHKWVVLKKLYIQPGDTPNSCSKAIQFSGKISLLKKREQVTTASIHANDHYVGTENYSGPPQVKHIDSWFTIQSSCNFATIEFLNPSGCDAEQRGANYCNFFVSLLNTTTNEWVGLGIGTNSQSLAPGTYRLRLQINNFPYNQFGRQVVVNVVTEKNEEEYNKQIGGLRIREIIDFDLLSGKRHTTAYFYNGFDSESGKSSGVLISEPVYRYQQASPHCVDFSGSNGQGSVCSPVNSYFLTSQSQIPLGSSQGSPVGYKNITEQKYSENIVLGETRYTFNVLPDPAQGFGYPFAPNANAETFRGSIIKKEVLASIGGQLKRAQLTSNEYQNIRNTHIYNGVKIGCLAYEQSSFGRLICGLPAIQPYQVWCGAPQLTRTEERVYENSLWTNFSTQVNEIKYGTAHMQPVETRRNSSSGDVQVSQTRYVMDVQNGMFTGVDPTTAAINNLAAKNVNVPVERVEKIIRGGQEFIKSADFCEYAPDNLLIKAVHRVELLSKIPATQFSFSHIIGNTLSKDVRYKPDFYFNRYDAKGNLLEQQKADDVKTSYIWGYGGQYPVAQVVGKSYDDAVNQSGVNLAVLNNPSSSEASLQAELNKLRSLSNALVTTYTYKPLVGMTSETDPRGRTTYYEYDGFGRLSVVRDHDRNVIKKYCYNYAGQQENCGVYTYAATRSGTFTRQCADGGSGSQVTYTANVSSTISQADADGKAQQDVNQNGQAYANQHGTCTWWSDGMSQTFTRQCGDGGVGTSQTITVNAGQYTSTASKQHANDQAWWQLQNLGQAYQSSGGYCTWYSNAINENFYKQGCPAGTNPLPFWVSIPANQFSSTQSKANANQLAWNEAQSRANNNGQCSAPAVYARLVVTDQYQSGSNRYGTVRIQFFSDAACTLSVSVSNLTVNYYKERGDCAGNNNTFNYSVLCSGTETNLGSRVIIYQNPRGICWYDDYYISTGTGYIIY